MRLLRVALALFLLCSCGFAQEEETGPAYFSLATNRTWAPGEKPAISVWGSNVKTLEFRVYRVNDPVKFFQSMADAHGFGGQAPPVQHTTTWIERFHSWKHGVWAGIRDFFRARFTATARSEIRDWQAGRKRQPLQKGEVFAQIPVLNRQQLVATWREPITSAHRWESATVQVPVSDRGVYLVEATNGKLRAYTIVMISEIAVITKSSSGRLLAFVTDRRTGDPVRDADVKVWTRQTKPLEFKTDTDGLADVKLAGLKAGSSESAMVSAEVKGDFAVNSVGSYFLRENEAFVTGYVYTDRPVYRPGDTVHYKIILRGKQHAVYQLPAVQQANVEVRDPEYNSIQRKDLPVSDYGTLKGEYVVPADAKLGNYQLTVSVGADEEGRDRANGSFYVEEYKKPEYDVKVTPEQKRVLEGDKIRATIEARYFFGEPVAGAKVTYAVHKWRYWYWGYAAEDDLDTSTAEEGGEEGDMYDAEQQSEQSGVLDQDGRLKIEIPTTVDGKKYDYTYRIEARVTDPSNREITGHGYVLATYGSYRFDVIPASYVNTAGSEASVNVDALDYDRKPVQSEFTIELRPEVQAKEQAAVFSATGRTDANGKANVHIPLKTAGWYVVVVKATTPEKREIEGRTWLWVTGGSVPWWYGGRAGERIQIVPDQKSYKPGDTAHVLILTNGPAHVLVTTEGADLFTQRVVNVTGPTVTVDVPILNTYAPNFFVNATFLRDNTVFEGSKSISVPPEEHKLAVEVKPSKAQYQPGEAANYTVKATDSSGKPVAAEFSLGVVDEAIYSIHPELAEDIVKAFYGTVYNRVSTENSLSYYFHGEAGHRQMQLTDVRRSRALAQLKPERLVQPKVRKAFPDTAYWIADVRTDSSGAAQVKFDFPDALTAWRATARAITKDTKVGSAVEKVIVRKNVMVRLAAPRFFRHDDEVTIGVLVHNYLTDAKTARVSLDVKGLTVVDGATRDVQVPSKGEVAVNWRVKAQKVSEATLLAEALTDVESDAMEISLPVQPYGVKQSIARSGSLADGSGQHDEAIQFPAAADAGSRRLEVSVTPSIAGAIFGALEYLTSYPYGCTEQTMSSFLPNIVVGQAVKELGLKTRVDPAELNRKVRAGVERLYTFQHPDGGWGWWETDDSHVFMTAYVLAGLSQAKHAGYEVKDDAINNARQWLAAKFAGDTKIIPDLRAYMAYALALSGEKSGTYIEAVFDQRAQLSAYGAALLGAALLEMKDPRAGELVAQIEKAAVVEGDQAHWEQRRDPMLDFQEDISAEATAYVVKFLANAKTDSDLLPKAAMWLVTHRNEGYWWDSTKQTAFVVYGLTDYLKQSGELQPNYSVEVEVNGRTVLTKSFSGRDAMSFEQPVARLDASQVTDGDKIVVRKKGSGRLYWSVRADYWSDEKRLVNQGSFSLNVAREYYKLTPVRQDNKIVYDMSKLDGPAQAGDVLAVRLTVSGGEWKYLLIEDPIPAGTEFILKDELYEVKGDKPAWWRNWYTRREFHDDRAAMFQTYFTGRVRNEYVYLLKVVNPGTFRVSPARVQPMYQPAFQATSDGLTVVVK